MTFLDGMYCIEKYGNFVEFTEEARKDFANLYGLDLISIADAYFGNDVQVSDDVHEIVKNLKTYQQHVISFERYEKTIVFKVLIAGIDKDNPRRIKFGITAIHYDTDLSFEFSTHGIRTFGDAIPL
jgi:hypothetical protein